MLSATLMDSGEPPSTPSTETHDDAGPRLDRRIGPYKLLKELGHGGMGVVYLAARADEQYHKRVALKVIKAGLDREEVIRHFRRERQILASLEHANIARFLDGGTTDDGLPYFVMEHVEGLRIDDYCDRKGLSTLERLRLFRPACSAIEYAHRNLIVHRDIKPGNLLVTSEGVPKLLDFGIARLTNPGLTGQTATATALVMTPEYASPEQARGETVTTASDVYSLGVVLYELLTGHLPYRLKTRNPLEVLRAVCDEEPEKPSAVLERATDAPPGRPPRSEDVGRTRDGTLERLRRRLRGDLDTILLMALQKEPSRRYSSVEAFSDDIRRYLEGLPIRARKTSFGYRAAKFMGRNWAGVASASVALLLILGFSASTWVQSARARKERDKAERVSAFLVDLFKVSDPGESRGNTVTAREILDTGARRVRGELRDDPEVRATLMHTIGNVYRSLGLYGESEELLRSALEARLRALGEHPDVATTLNDLARVRYRRGDNAEAEALHRQALAMRRRLLGEEHPEVANAMHNLALVLWDKGDYAAAEPLFRDTLAMQRRLLGEHIDVAKTMGSLAIVLAERGDYSGAEAAFRESLAIQRRLLGDQHPDVGIAMDNLAELLSEHGDYGPSESMFREALALKRKLYGARHPEVAYTIDGMARALIRNGAAGEAEALLREALAVSEGALGKQHALVASLQAGLADALRDLGRPEESEALYRSALGLVQKQLSAEHPAAAKALAGRGRLLTESGRPGAAEPLLREALEIRRKALPGDHPDIAETESLLGACLAAQGRYAEAEPLLLAACPRIEAKRTDRSREARDARSRIVGLYEAWGRPEKAREHAALLARIEDATRAAAAPGRSPAPGP